MRMDLFVSRPKADSKQLVEIKEWAAEVFHLGADVSVMVTEVRCTEVGCPPLETVIAILDVPGKPRQFKIHKAVADVTFADVLKAAQSDGNACHKENCS